MSVFSSLSFANYCPFDALIFSSNFSSATDGPDFLAKELKLVKNMNLAIKEERYKDAGILF